MAETDQHKDENRADKSHPPEGEYPTHWVEQYPGGIRVVIGNEKGKESYAIYHPSGTYMQMFPDGTSVSMHIGENKQYNKGGVTLTVDENGDIHIRGHHKLQVGGGSHVEVQGDAGIIVGGDVALAGLGNIGMNAHGNLYLGVRGNMSFNVEGNFKAEVKGTTTMLSEGSTTVATKGDMAMSSSGNMGLDSGGSLTTNAGGGNYSAGQVVHHNSGSTPETKTTDANYSALSDSGKDVGTAGMG
jgi:hypothetical protein